MKKILTLASISLIFILQSCQTAPPIQTVEALDLERFMGDWYVIANIPTFIEKDAYNAIESYRLDGNGDVLTTFTFNKGGFDGPVKKYTPKGFIRDKRSNAVWAMQFIWPLLGLALGVYVIVLGVLFGRQGCAYLPTHRWGWDDPWAIDRASNPVLFWIVIVLLILAGALQCVYAVRLLMF